MSARPDPRDAFRSWGQRLTARLVIGLLAALGAAMPALAQDTLRGVGRTDLEDVATDAWPDEPSINEIVAAHQNDFFGIPQNTRVVGGSEATAGEWPSMVAIYLKQPVRAPFNFCGGTAIGHGWVLTAAHCAAAMKRMATGSSFFVREGTIDLSAPTHHDIAVTEIIANDSFDPNLTLNDVALLKLSGSLTSPRQKLVGESRVADVMDKPPRATVIGFGVTQEGGNASTHLREVDVPIVDQATCRALYGEQSITDANFCAGVKDGGKDSCQGDSGGPLLIRDATGEPLQAGVVSWGKGCARAGFYGVYASVGRFEGWIKARVPDAVFVEKLDTAAPVDATTVAVSALTTGATEATDPDHHMAQVSIDIAQGGRVKVGSFIDVRIRSSVSGTVVVFNQNPDGRAYQLYPSKAFPAPGAALYAARINAGEVLSIPSAEQHENGYRFLIQPPAGVNHLRAVVVPDSPKVQQIVQDHAGGDDIRDLTFVMNDLVDAEIATRGPEPFRVTPTDRGSAEKVYEIVK